MLDFNHLLNQYAKLLHLSLSNEEDADAKSRLYSLMKTELLDERTHPRLRIKPEEKYYIAIKRVLRGELSQNDQLSLIQLYTHTLDAIKSSK